jgi:hypothetical protein
MYGCQAAKEVFVMSDSHDGGNFAQRTYTASQVAEILGVSLRTASNLCETTKDFKVIRMGRRCLRVHKESFDSWLDSEHGTLS